ncbi:glycine-rich cell wall structural protein-like [Nilaparvata lugens]|uniref:glycine-rich cell wall structural protein-like n=1 Tax=Nilaparvata lugens TaxID=108931 RepID=UPI000B99677D|nr:glycine-rich cell wall structural protein-like [Nilaparvata lugens]
MEILNRKQRAAFVVVVLLLRCVDGRGGGGGGGHGGGGHGAAGHGEGGHGAAGHGVAGRAGIRGGMGRALAFGAVGIIGIGAAVAYADAASKASGGQAGGGSNDDMKLFNDCFNDADSGSDTYQNTADEFDIY